MHAPVAQLDRASASGAEGCRFEPCRARFLFPRGFAPRTPLHARSRGPLRPAPLAWLTRAARSLLGLFPRGLPLGLPYTLARGDPSAPLRSSFSEGLRPSDSPTRSLAVPARPRSAPVAHSLRSLAWARVASFAAARP